MHYLLWIIGMLLTLLTFTLPGVMTYFLVLKYPAGLLQRMFELPW